MTPTASARDGARKRERLHETIHDVVRTIPKGRVATYGQIAVIVERCTPRMVGYAMAAVPFGTDVPWHRVINAQGRVSARGGGDGAETQRVLLEAEGVAFDESGRVDLARVGWTGPGVARGGGARGRGSRGRRRDRRRAAGRRYRSRDLGAS